MQATLSQYFGSRHCLSCKSLCSSSICNTCLHHPITRQECAVNLNSEITYIDRKLAHINQVIIFLFKVLSTSGLLQEIGTSSVSIRKLMVRGGIQTSGLPVHCLTS